MATSKKLSPDKEEEEKRPLVEEGKCGDWAILNVPTMVRPGTRQTTNAT